MAVRWRRGPSPIAEGLATLRLLNLNFDAAESWELGAGSWHPGSLCLGFALEA